jgi:hypothetical protein
VAGVEVVDAQEEADPTGELVADGRLLLVAIGGGEEDARLRTGGRTTTQRFGRPSFVRAAESSTSSKPSVSTKKAIASS